MSNDYDLINVCEVLSDKDLHTIADLIWKALDKAGIETSDDAELSLKVHNYVEVK